MAAKPSGWTAVYRVVRRIPAGRVATYGQVAALAGMPGAARQVGWALHALGEEDDVPWQRVINARGEVSARGIREIEDLQRSLLQSEGVDFNRNGRIDLARFAWEPTSRRKPLKETTRKGGASRAADPKPIRTTVQSRKTQSTRKQR